VAEVSHVRAGSQDGTNFLAKIRFDHGSRKRQCDGRMRSWHILHASAAIKPTAIFSREKFQRLPSNYARSFSVRFRMTYELMKSYKFIHSTSVRRTALRIVRHCVACPREIAHKPNGASFAAS
jgi:hypothetical protein